MNCERCEDYFDEEDLEEIEGEMLCAPCIDEINIDNVSETVQTPRRKFDGTTKKFISKTSGEIIKSNRTFGVELETINPKIKNIASLAKDIDVAFGFERDGSLIGNNPIEIVSPVLGGATGEKTLIDVLSKMEKLNFDTNESCGLHVHLDGAGFVNSSVVSFARMDKKEDSEKVSKISNGTMYIISRKLVSEIQEKLGLDRKKIIDLLCNWAREQSRWGLIRSQNNPLEIELEYSLYSLLSNFNGKECHQIAYPNKVSVANAKRTVKENIIKFNKILSKDVGWDARSKMILEEFGTRNESLFLECTFKPKKDDYIVNIVHRRNIDNVKALLYLHTAFQDFFYSLIPPDRRNGYKHCQSLSLGFAPREIELIQSQEQLEKMWYKTRSIMEIENRKNGRKYDPSRYYGLNLHSLFAQNKTVEIRYHAGTIDTTSILYWIALHQNILDGIVAGRITISRLKQGAGLFGVEGKTDFLLDNLRLTPELEKYVVARIKHFSN